MPDYNTWVAETPWLNAPSAVDSSAEAQSQIGIGIDTARVAAAPALVSVAAAGADKANKTADKTADKTNEADKAAVGDKTDKANGSDAGSVDRRYKHTEGLFGGG